MAGLRAELAALPQNDAMRLAVPFAYDVIQVVDSHLDTLPADAAPRSCRGGVALLGTSMRRPEGLVLAACSYGVRAGEPYVTLTLPDGRLFEVP